ncbi:MAG: hypothetical protein LBK58_00870 [Prevotellaceae bacterium]|jgi:hypothetical protein|nr:hypothetical protein [Prevotellaceae bacterium]
MKRSDWGDTTAIGGRGEYGEDIHKPKARTASVWMSGFPFNLSGYG